MTTQPQPDDCEDCPHTWDGCPDHRDPDPEPTAEERWGTPWTPDTDTTATAQPLDTAAIQAARAAATAGLWWADGHEIYAGPTGIPAASVWVGETCNVDLLDGGEANAAAIVSAHNALPALLARVADLEQQLAAYEGLQLADPDGRISTTCTKSLHPTWLRYPADAQYFACPWCALDDATPAASSAR